MTPSPPRPPFEAMAIRRKAGRGEQMHCFYAMQCPLGRGVLFFRAADVGAQATLLNNLLRGGNAISLHTHDLAL